jgi:cobaltochelatase CobT
MILRNHNVLSKWPMLAGLWRRFQPETSPVTSEYVRFTTAYDEIIPAGMLPKCLLPMTPEAEKSYTEAVAAFEAGFQAERIAIAENACLLVRDLRSRFTHDQRCQTAVTFLIDHSGSMQGLRMISALIAVQGAVQALEQSGIATEILGFTTVNWKGGRVREMWRWAGKPEKPGRLCDLRHIVYAGVGNCPRLPWSIRYALRPGLLRENVDGEALEWAAARLDGGQWERKLICMISDGAPMDDSTLAENGMDYLYRHFEAVLQTLKQRGMLVATLSLGEFRMPSSQLLERAAEPASAGIGVLSLIRHALLEVTRQAASP